MTEHAPPIESQPLPAEEAPPGPGVPGYGEIFGFAVPLMLGMLSYALLTVVDAAFVGRLGTAQLAALGMAGVFYFTGLVLFVGLMRNSIAFIARAYGAGHPQRVGEILAQYQWLALLGLPVLLALSRVFPWMLDWSGLNPEVTGFATLYLNIRLWDIPFALTLILYSSLYQSLGNSRFPMLIQLSAVVLNGVLDYVLIFGKAGFPALGIAGAALATVIAQALGCGLIVVWAHATAIRRRCQLRLLGRPRGPLLREILTIGIPQGLGDFVEVLAFMGFFFLVGSLGEHSLAANNVGVQVTHLLFMPGYALGIAAASYMGRLLGSHLPHVAERTSRRIVRIGVIYMALAGIPLWFLGEPIAGIFTHDPLVILLAGLVFKVMALYQGFDALGIVCRGALSGAGDTLVPTLLMGACAVLVFYPAAWLLMRAFQPGVMGAWLGAAIYLVVVGLGMKLRFDRGAWRSIRISSAA